MASETYSPSLSRTSPPLLEKIKDDLVFPPKLPPLRVRILSEEYEKDQENEPKAPKRSHQPQETEKENPQKKSKATQVFKEEGQEKWEGKATEKLTGVTLEQVWGTPLDDFCSFHKWLPTIGTCHHVQGLKGQPGVIRYCASATTSSIVKWCYEKLISVDPLEHCISYQVLDNNMGLKYYVATIQVSELEKGYEIEWSFIADPVEGMTCEVFVGYLSFALKGMVHNMEKALCCTNLKNDWKSSREVLFHIKNQKKRLFNVQNMEKALSCNNLENDRKSFREVLFCIKNKKKRLINVQNIEKALSCNNLENDWKSFKEVLFYIKNQKMASFT